MKNWWIAVLGTALLAGGCGNPINNGSCVPECAPGFHCDNAGTCVFDGVGDMSTGADGMMGMGCDPACKGLTPLCNASNHCVACLADGDCPIGQRCNVVSPTVASCVTGCMTDDRCHKDGENLTMVCCNKMCVDTAKDSSNCGMCGMSCTANHAQGTCSASACTVGSCDNGWGDCNNDGKDGCETNLHLDENNCMVCGNQCALVNAVQGCSDGCYIKACSFGWDDCNQNMDDGCETSVLTDTNNCGSCSSLCKSLPNANASCTAGNCVLGTCLQGFFNCDNDPKNGCESDLQNDAKNCNGCGNLCPNNNPFCNKGVCGQVPPAVTYTGSFVVNVTPGQACTDWKTFQAALTNGPYNTVTIKGSLDQVGSSCVGAGANTICQALRNNQQISVMCSGKTWTTGPCGPGTEISSTGSNCGCNNGYTARPCIGNLNWGGINGVTCTAPTQTITVFCQQ